jgi:DNA adenine methylase
LPHLQQLIPAAFNDYYEPFFGGGALYFGCVARSTFGGRAILSDANTELMNFYSVLRSSPEPLIGRLLTHAQLHSPEHYAFVAHLDRTDFFGDLEDIERAARLAYLSAVSFNGGYRVGRNGQFVGGLSMRNWQFFSSISGLRKASRALRHALMPPAEFRDILSEPKEGDFVYLDPPYLKEDLGDDTTHYTPQPFSARDQSDLMDCLETLSARGAHVLLSSPDFELHARMLPPNYVIRKRITARRLREVLVSNYPT